MAFMPVDGEHVISSRQALTLDRLPESMIVVGSRSHRQRIRVVLRRAGREGDDHRIHARMMPLEDEEVSKTMERAFRKLRATVLTSTTVKAVKVNAEGLCEVEIEGKKGAETLTAGIVLSAWASSPTSKASASKSWASPSGARQDRGGQILPHQRPGRLCHRRHRAGPGAGARGFGRAVCCVEAICGLNPAPVDYTTIPSCIFTQPEVASVGMTEQQAQGARHSLQGRTLPVHRIGQGDGSRRPRWIRQTALRRRRPPVRSPYGRGVGDRDAGRTDAGAHAGRHSPPDRPHDPRPSDDERGASWRLPRPRWGRRFTCDRAAKPQKEKGRFRTSFFSAFTGLAEPLFQVFAAVEIVDRKSHQLVSSTTTDAITLPPVEMFFLKMSITHQIAHTRPISQIIVPIITI